MRRDDEREASAATSRKRIREEFARPAATSDDVEIVPPQVAQGPPSPAAVADDELECSGLSREEYDAAIAAAES